MPFSMMCFCEVRVEVSHFRIENSTSYLKKRHVIHRIHVQVLIVSQDEQDVWLLGGRKSTAKE